MNQPADAHPARKVHKQTHEIAAEWDRLADIRLRQLEAGQDLSFHHVLLPTVRALAEGLDLTQVIDVGCGVGFLSAELAEQAQHVVGVDISQRSIEIARQRYESRHSNLHFDAVSIEQFSPRHQSEFSLAVANMMLMDVLDLDAVLAAIRTVLRPEGHLIATVTHPWFWPEYWGYQDLPWFDYKREIQVEAPFVLSLERSSTLRTTHVHRPLERYVSALQLAGFVLESLVEPVPDAEDAARYPDRWDTPRFLGMVCRKRV